MCYLDVNSNIMSLGGLALAIGVLVDASIVMVENAYRHVSEPDQPLAYEDQPRVIIGAAKQVARSIFFSLAIIIVSFVPVFLLEAQEGRMFRPSALLRLRPKLMTVTVVMASLVPIMRSAGVGSDVMKPIAAPIIGGMVTSTIHVLMITPVIFHIMKIRALHKGTLRLSLMTH